LEASASEFIYALYGRGTISFHTDPSVCSFVLKERNPYVLLYDYWECEIRT